MQCHLYESGLYMNYTKLFTSASTTVYVCKAPKFTTCLVVVHVNVANS